jgi:hypothetical protein
MSSFAIANKTYPDSLLADVNNLKETYENKVSSYEKELIFYKVKEDFFFNIISKQTEMYIFIVTSLFSLVGLFVYFIYNKQLKDFKEETKSFKEDINKEFNTKINKIEIKFKSLHKETYTNQANMAVLLAHKYSESKHSDLEFIYYIKASYYSMKSVQSMSEPDYKFLNIYIQNACNVLDTIKKKNVKIYIENICKEIVALEELNNDDINKCLKKIKQFIQIH